MPVSCFAGQQETQRREVIRKILFLAARQWKFRSAIWMSKLADVTNRCS
jgi:hypothetical protein